MGILRCEVAGLIGSSLLLQEDQEVEFIRSGRSKQFYGFRIRLYPNSNCNLQYFYLMQGLNSRGVDILFVLLATGIRSSDSDVLLALLLG